MYLRDEFRASLFISFARVVGRASIDVALAGNEPGDGERRRCLPGTPACNLETPRQLHDLARLQNQFPIVLDGLDGEACPNFTTASRHGCISGWHLRHLMIERTKETTRGEQVHR